ncbi:MAG: alanine dehydrogenase [Saprospiraceae bacterium]|nr:alanine dehydrogenase [Saprospiraceae bacterium]
MSDKKKLTVEEYLSMGQYETKAQVVESGTKRQKMTIGVPAEITLQEKRVSLVPSSVALLVGRGHHVMVETSAGGKSNFTDMDFSEVGAEIVYDKERVFGADCLLKVAPPTLEEIDLLHPNQIVISPLHLPYLTRDYLVKLKEKRTIAIAMEYLKDSDGSFPVVTILGEIAGISAILTASELLNNSSGGNGLLLGGISGVPPANVVILGAGIVAEFASRSALGLGANLTVFDNNISKLARLQNKLGQRLSTSSLNSIYLERALKSADVVIGAMHAKSGRTPMVVNEDMVRKMKPGSVIVDISIDQGGCFETSRVTSHENPTFVQHEVIHYCVPNISSKVARTASIAISNILTPILLNTGEASGIERFLFANHGMRNGIYSYKGCLTNEYLADRYDLKYTDLDLLITSNL